MKTVSLSGSLRENVGKKDTKALRKAEMVPCVMYGSGEEQVHFATEAKNFKKIHVVSCAPLFADVIHRVESYESISSLFK